MFGEFTVPADMHDLVYFDLVAKGYIPQEPDAKLPASELETV
jgi:hypothetical protein